MCYCTVQDYIPDVHLEHSFITLFFITPHTFNYYFFLFLNHIQSYDYNDMQKEKKLAD